MSLTNPTDVVTEQRLKDFYDGIFPYLGGMPEAIANKFSKSDIYSTSERMIGQWTDGKPLYQKTFTGTLNLGSGTAQTVAHGIANVNAITSRSGYILAGGTTYFLPFGYTNGNGFFVDAFANTTDINFRCHNDYNSAPYIITLQYTKSTDSAISIGNDTDYSTDEKIVGTWIDGKPIYQITYQLQSVLTIAPNTWTDTGIPVGNITSIIKCFGKNGGTYAGDLMAKVDSTNIEVFTFRQGNNNTVNSLTFQYTKTS